MSASPPPLPLPSDVDVSDMPHLPLFDMRLMRSRAWLRAKSWRGDGPGLGFVLINLWSAAFRSTPSGSLEDDDDVLADAAMCDIVHWRVLRDVALRGWVAIGGRWHHPVLSEICLDLWIARLDARHENATRSWRMVVKRKADAGIEPPDPPGDKAEWLARAYPLTSAYLARRDGHTITDTYDCDGNSATPPLRCDSHIDPKRSKGKELNPPIVPPAPQKGLGTKEGAKAGKQGKAWFAAELKRLGLGFGPMLPLMLSQLQRPGVSGRFALVDTFKGAWFEPREGAILMPTKRRADSVIAQHGEWLRHYWPALKIRHATIDELLDFNRRQAA